MSPVQTWIRQALLFVVVLLLAHSWEVLASVVPKDDQQRHARWVGIPLPSRMFYPSGVSTLMDKSVNRVLENSQRQQVHDHHLVPVPVQSCTHSISKRSQSSTEAFGGHTSSHTEQAQEADLDHPPAAIVGFPYDSRPNEGLRRLLTAIKDVEEVSSSSALSIVARATGREWFAVDTAPITYPLNSSRIYHRFLRCACSPSGRGASLSVNISVRAQINNLRIRYDTARDSGLSRRAIFNRYSDDAKDALDTLVARYGTEAVFNAEFKFRGAGGVSFCTYPSNYPKWNVVFSSTTNRYTTVGKCNTDTRFISKARFLAPTPRSRRVVVTPEPESSDSPSLAPANPLLNPSPEPSDGPLSTGAIAGIAVAAAGLVSVAVGLIYVHLRRSSGSWTSSSSYFAFPDADENSSPGGGRAPSADGPPVGSGSLAAAAIARRRNDSPDGPSPPDASAMEAEKLPQPPPLARMYSDIEAPRPSAPNASQLSDMTFLTSTVDSTTSTDTIVAPEFKTVPSTGETPPYWRLGEKG